MAIGNVVNIEFLNHNALRNYPLLDEVSRKDTSDSFTLPNDFLVDFSLTVHEDADVDPSLFYIYSVSIFTIGVVVNIGYNNSIIASISISKTGHTLNKTYWFSGEGIFADSRGKLTIGSLNGINTAPAGNWLFNVAATRILPTLIKPSLRGVQSLIFINGSERSSNFTGDVKLKAGTNIRFDVDQLNNAVTINAINGEGFNTTCDCEGTAIGPPIRSINGITANSSGAFQLLGSECINVAAAVNNPNSVLLEDTCSSPCCGCAELEVITEALRQLQNSELTLKEFMNRLDSNMRALETNLVASKTGNVTCP